MAPDNLATTETTDTLAHLPDELVARLRGALVAARAEALGEASPDRGDEHADVLTAYNRDAVEAIDHALGRIDDGTYGTCERCSQPIPVERLEAVPAASRCVSCTAAGPGFLG